jgi:hypothetical protein
MEGAMTRYFFDVHASPLQKDDKGTELGDLDQAKEHARHVARTVVKSDGALTNAEVTVRDPLGEVFRLQVATDCDA